ncbi:hypothetical protein RHGRI_008019 [Rhododendron griersonianum]|uniref:Cytochrome P450 n=1 Tax=Rhododendron griersonianum TaxID=479676 RepID=A0AAV6KYV7_9ERIC|nr:hypothetical protein RHGRI_008019 [Rhododendron griersonianum]
MEYSTHFSFYLLTFSLPLLTFLLLRLHSSRLRRHLHIPPGTLGLPFLGETLQVMSAFKSSNPDTFIDDRVSRLGSPVFTSHVFGEPTVFSADHETNRFILMNEGKLFESSYPGSMTFALTVKQLMSLDSCEWTERLRKEYILVIEGFLTIPSPLFSTTYRRAVQARGKVAEALRMAVRERRKRENEGGERKKKDMLGALLDEEGSGDGLSEEEIVDFLVSILEEQDEIRSRKGKSEALQWNDYKSMSFTECVVNETLRVANISSGVFRRAMTDVDVKGEYNDHTSYTIPKGWIVFASSRAVHLNHDHFKDARTFDPWRWQAESRTENSINLFNPFGGGPRYCPGAELARVTLSVFLHHLVTQFSWVPAEEDKLVFWPTVRMQKGYPIIVQRLN